MEALEEVMGPKDLTHIVKGKRTKRQRPQSPTPFTITTHSSSGDGGGYGGTNSSPATSVEFHDSTTEEDEDTAKCLILLSQGHSEPPNNNSSNNNEDCGTYKFTSKRFLEAPTSANGKAGIYVYECKTCNRTFPSFQALGGHRASHKKPKAVMEEKKKKKPTFVVSDDEEEPPFKSNNISCLSLQLSNRVVYSNNKSSKVHECSICGAEFTSGQALGGHMRRHRAPVGGSCTNTTLSLSSIAMESEESKKPRNIVLSLDLNLPAPEDEHHRDSKFAFASKKQQQQQQKQQQSALVLSATPTLVDCHY